MAEQLYDVLKVFGAKVLGTVQVIDDNEASNIINFPISVGNTKWELNSLINTGTCLYTINFGSNGNNYSSLSVTSEGLKYGETLVFDGANWTSDEYKTIEISDGTDIQNQGLILWLMSNGQKIVDSPASSFADIEVTDHAEYITLVINGVSIDIEKDLDE